MKTREIWQPNLLEESAEGSDHLLQDMGIDCVTEKVCDENCNDFESHQSQSFSYEQLDTPLGTPKARPKRRISFTPFEIIDKIFYPEM